MPIPLIVITNDDGINSPGLRAVARAVADLGEILVVAPRTQQTSMGRAFRGRGNATPVKYVVNRRSLRAFAVPSSPAVAVRHAVLLIADRTPALVISGINYGENIGNGVTISGTVGAALEASALGVPALAASLATPLEYHRTHSTDIDFAVAAYFTRVFAERILKCGMPNGVDVVNVNVPQDVAESAPWRWTRVSRSSYFHPTVRQTRSGKRFSGYAVITDHAGIEDDSDIHALLVDHVVSVSPLTLDLTANAPKQSLERWAE